MSFKVPTSLVTLSPRGRTGIVILSITFFSALYLWYANANHIDDLTARYRAHLPSLRPESSDTWDGSYGSLENKLAYQELEYQEYLKDRQRLIKKWGPTIDQVQTFPHNGKFYTMWDFFIPAFSCPFPVSRTGQLGDGGKFVCGLDRIIKRPNCIIYSLGVEGDSSFEAAILHRSSSCIFYGYDYSVSKWGPEISNSPSWAPRVNFKPWKIAKEDKHDITPPEHTIQSLFAANGHEFVDILKVDVEGAEFDALESLVNAYRGRPLPFGQLQLEIHVWGNMTDFSKFLGWWEMLEGAGLRPFWTELNIPHVNVGNGPDVAEWSFINTRGRHALVTDL